MAENNTMIQSSSTSYISSLSDELSVEILCRLGSSKYATQCKCICKRWFSLIDSTNPQSYSYFLRRWKQIHRKPDTEGEEEEEELPTIALLTQYQDCAMDAFYSQNPTRNNHHLIDYYPSFNPELPTVKSLNYLPNSSDIDPVYILATFKDLVLCCPHKNDHSVYYICNVMTRQWKALPRPPPVPFVDKFLKVQVGLVVSEDNFGTNSLELKVVRVFDDLDTSPDVREPNSCIVKVEIFSSNDNSGEWRHVEMRVPQCCFLYKAVSYNEMIVLLSKSETERIFAFKFHPHAFRPNDIVTYTCLPLPPDYKKDHHLSSRIGVCKGRLRIGQIVYPEPYALGRKLVIWELNSNSHCWELVHDLDLSEVNYEDVSISTRSYQIGMGYIMDFHPHDGDQLYLYFVSLCRPSPSSMYLFDLRNKTVGKIRGLHTVIPPWDGNVFLVHELPSWPTQIPRIPPASKAIRSGR